MNKKLGTEPEPKATDVKPIRNLSLWYPTDVTTLAMSALGVQADLRAVGVTSGRSEHRWHEWSRRDTE